MFQPKHCSDNWGQQVLANKPLSQPDKACNHQAWVRNSLSSMSSRCVATTQPHTRETQELLQASNLLRVILTQILVVLRCQAPLHIR